MDNNNYSKIIDGKQIANELLQSLKLEIQAVVKANGIRAPSLAVVLCGEDPASHIYVKHKQKACLEVGIHSQSILLSKEATTDALLQIIDKLNLDPQIDAILVQLPMPEHINTKLIIDKILPIKDVDGFSRYNMGSLAISDPIISPCTPQGIMYLLNLLNISYPGKHVVIIGASNIVGKPIAIELINRGATVTVCNIHTVNISEITRLGDILIIAAGSPRLLKASWIKEGAVIIDVGINRNSDNTIVGDVDFEEVLPKASVITPVPGGVGPLTIAMLVANTLKCYKLNNKL